MRLAIGLCVGLAATLAIGMLPPANTAHAAAPLRITIDPGHGGREIGTSYRFADGVVLQEKDLNLRVAFRLRQLLQQAGFIVTLTRTTDTPVNIMQQDLNGDGRVSLADELQARVDAANAAGSNLFVSICFNGSSDASVRGTETFWNPNRPFSDHNRQLAERVQNAMIVDLAAVGYQTRDRGANTDASLLNGDAFFLLGRQSSIIARPSQMPAIIGEPLFLSNPADANALRDDRILEAIARGFFDGIHGYTASTHNAAPAAQSATPRPEPLSAPATRHWTIWTVTYSDTTRGQRLAQEAVRGLAAQGLSTNVLTTAHVPALLPGFLVVTTGAFDTRSAALARLAQVRLAGYTDAYIRTVPQ
jgi:N-acetylmuramoyl-L-alanine amidase